MDLPIRSVLILGYSYPPNGNMAAQRAAALARYLPQSGWQPLVIAGEWNKANCRTYDPASSRPADEQAVVARAPVVSAAAASRRGLVQRFGDAFRFLSGRYQAPQIWTHAVLREARPLLSTRRVDALWASFGPPGAHFCADKLSQEFGLPWVADFRDVWHAGWRMWRWLVRQEVRVCRTAQAITTVSPALVNLLSSRHSQPVFLVPNGFDALEFSGEVKQGSGKFEIVYAGNIARSIRDPQPLFSALDLLAEREKIDLAKVAVRFVGTKQESLQGLQRFRSAACISRTPWLPRAEAIVAQRQATILLHLSTPEMKGTMTGKIFEYLASRRPILSIPGDNDCVDDLLRRTKGGTSLAQPEAIAEQLLRWYEEWEATGTVRWAGEWQEVAKYSRRAQARAVARILTQACERHAQEGTDA